MKIEGYAIMRGDRFYDPEHMVFLKKTVDFTSILDTRNGLQGVIADDELKSVRIQKVCIEVHEVFDTDR